MTEIFTLMKKTGVPEDVYREIFRFLQHPAAKIIKESNSKYAPDLRMICPLGRHFDDYDTIEDYLLDFHLGNELLWLQIVRSEYCVDARSKRMYTRWVDNYVDRMMNRGF